jgi:hypothetical protein
MRHTAPGCRCRGTAGNVSPYVFVLGAEFVMIAPVMDSTCALAGLRMSRTSSGLIQSDPPRCYHSAT